MSCVLLKWSRNAVIRFEATHRRMASSSGLLEALHSEILPVTPLHYTLHTFLSRTSTGSYSKK